MENGTKLYTFKINQADSVEEWTYISKENGLHRLYDPSGRYRELTTIKGFFENKEHCEIQIFKCTLRNLKNEKRVINDEIKKHQVKIRRKRIELKDNDKKVEHITNHYKYLQDQYPEEFI